jgi:phage recombination protein Bet
MSDKTELAVQGPRGVVGDKYDQAEVLSAIRQTVCKGATDAQLRMFIEVCRSTGLNPWLKEIYYVPEKGIIMAARDGYLRVANENPQFDGMETRVDRDEKNVPIKATCTVWRKDRKHPIICEAYYSEYKKPGPVWSQYPSAMISKVAEVLALKRSFAINGCVTEEEIGNDGAGSVEAAQAVAEAKLSGARPLIEAVAEVTSEDTGLHDDIAASTELKQRVPYDKFRMMREFETLKTRFVKIRREDEYRRILLSFGAHKRTDLPTNDEGVTARRCYKELLLTVADMEVKSAMSQDVEILPDAVPLTLGTQVRHKGILYTVTDSEDGYRWEREAQPVDTQ